VRSWCSSVEQKFELRDRVRDLEAQLQGQGLRRRRVRGGRSRACQGTRTALIQDAIAAWEAQFQQGLGGPDTECRPRDEAGPAVQQGRASVIRPSGDKAPQPPLCHLFLMETFRGPPGRGLRG